jgi:Zn-dependent M28 family amino/carboxypeptidase
LVGHLRHRRPLLLSADQIQSRTVPIVVADNDQLKNWLERPNTTSGNRTISFDVPAPQDHKVVLKNVIGILRGSDPKLKDTCVLLTAHYDHIGTSETGREMSPQSPKNTEDHIYNGANDDGSGTVSVIEIARALSTLTPHPKRSIVFMTFFGEERGDIGSGYYGKHPVFPISKTVADLNLEQVGRTDSTEGKQLNNASVTGFDYSDVTAYLQNAGRQLGISVYLNKEASDAYFTRSDNAALAEQGVPAHTLCVAFDYPDYHGLGDEWQKVDYENMAKVDRAVALAALNMANSLQVPQWNAKNPKTAAFREAQAKSLKNKSTETEQTSRLERITER